MIRRKEASETVNEQVALVESLRSGVNVMNDPAVEARVVEYFVKNPSFSRDAIHVAAVACRVREELELPHKPTVERARTNSVSRPPSP
jgi:hypothetical protein